jgi:MraZ protein
MFRGEFNVKIDKDGRIYLPAVLREALAETDSDDRIVITQAIPLHLDDGEIARGLVAYPHSRWLDRESIVEEIKKSKRYEKEAIARLILGKTKICVADGKGRITIPKIMRQYACLENGVVLVGCMDNIGIWNQSTWDKVVWKAIKDLP